MSKATTTVGKVTGTGVEFGEFFRSEYPRLAEALYLMTRDSSEAEDIAQEAMARAFERWNRIREMESPAGYVFRTALNLYRSRLRRLAVRARKLSPPIRSSDPEEVAEMRSEVMRALSSVPRPQREALILVEWVGFNAEEAGRVLGIAASSVRGRLHRARILLRERFGGQDA